ncbi:hypothetical protein IGS73_15680 [Janibacter indicus]|uniref:Uncharacterized protein n=1 Tax=Janibacter indicus TaxID=857417 RepID=A0A7L9IYX7_9MICO|nr:hypothetical protein [Janibacter indicus]QOK22488.1 hypothetical protein IGS73_15680 [Janibacter indicus]
MTPQTPSRRTIVKGAAWSAPVVTIAAAAPWLAASPDPTPPHDPHASVSSGGTRTSATNLNISPTNFINTGTETVEGVTATFVASGGRSPGSPSSTPTSRTSSLAGQDLGLTDPGAFTLNVTVTASTSTMTTPPSRTPGTFPPPETARGNAKGRTHSGAALRHAQPLPLRPPPRVEVPPTNYPVGITSPQSPGDT